MSEDHTPTSAVFNQPKVSAAEIADALVENKGNMAAAARDLGMRRWNLSERINSSPELISLLSDMREEVIDNAEGFQFARAQSGADPAAERFILSTLGKTRGYSTAVGGTGAGGDIVVSIRKFSDENGD